MTLSLYLFYDFLYTQLIRTFFLLNEHSLYIGLLPLFNLTALISRHLTHEKSLSFTAALLICHTCLTDKASHLFWNEIDTIFLFLFFFAAWSIMTHFFVAIFYVHSIKSGKMGKFARLGSCFRLSRFIDILSLSISFHFCMYGGKKSKLVSTINRNKRKRNERKSRKKRRAHDHELDESEWEQKKI